MSAIAYIKPGEILIKSHFILYGSLASVEIGEAISKEINEMWNAPNAQWNDEYQIRFSVDSEVLSDEEVTRRFMTDQSYENIFIRIEKENITERSMMGYGLGENSGHWIVTDNLGTSTTAAHEYGHALGLPHPDQFDYRGSGFPPIMAPRGTLVDAEFQWNPTADVGAFGGTMKPIYRKVRTDEVLAVLANLNPNLFDEFRIGRLSNNLYDVIGNPIRMLTIS